MFEVMGRTLAIKGSRIVAFLGVLGLLVTACAASPKTEIEHQDPADAPPHLHLDDGATVSIAPGDSGDLVEKLFNNEAVIVGAPDESAQTAVLTIPTMF